MQNILKKGSIKIKTKNIIEPLPDSFGRPANRPNAPIVCNLDQLLTGILQILKKSILYNYRVKSAKNGKVLVPEDSHTAPNCN